MRYAFTILSLFTCAAFADADGYCYRSRNLYHDTGYTYTYHAAGWWNNRYYPAGNYAWINGNWHLQGYGVHYGYAYPTYETVKIIYKEVEPDYYASVNSFYRDSLLADAIAYRVLTATKTGAVPTAPAQSIPPYGEPEQQPAKRAAVKEAAVRTAVSPALAKYVSESCLKCHNGPGGKGGVDLSSLETVPVGIRWACHGTVSSGEMPKGGKEASDQLVKDFYDWARAATKAQPPANNSTRKGDENEQNPALPGDRRRAVARRE